MSLKKNDTIVGSFGAGVFLVMMVSALVGGTDIVGPPTPPDDPGWWVDQPLLKGTDTEPGQLAAGASMTKEYGSMDTIIRTINATLTWSDETDPPARRIRRHENQPDAFTLTIGTANRSTSDSGSNPQGGEGRIAVSLTFTDNELYDMGGYQNISVTVSLDTTGIWLPVIGLGQVGLKDDGNAFDLLIEYDYYQLELISEGQG